MNAQHWEKLRKNWPELLEEKSEYLIPLLYQRQILTEAEHEHISNLTCNRNKMEALLRKLKRKPAQSNCFSELLSALQKLSPWLAEAIMSTETTSDPSLTAAVDPHILDGEASKVLRRCFCSQKKSQTSLQSIRYCLENNGVFKDYCKWNNKKLIRFVEEEFVGVKFVKKAKLFNNLGNNSMDYSLQTSDCLSDGSLPLSDQSREAVATCTMPSLGGLNGIFKENGLHPKVKISRACSAPNPSQRKTDSAVDRQWSLLIKTTAAQSQINGRMLSPQKIGTPFRKSYILGNANQKAISRQLSRSNSKDFLEKSESSAKIHCCSGDKTKNHCMKFKANSDFELPHMKLCSFQSKVEPSDTYLHGHCLKLPCSSQHGKLKPVKNFLVPEIVDGSNIYWYIVFEIVKFSAACLNDRQNGTIYFGVKSDKTEAGLEVEIVGVQLNEKKLVKILNHVLQNYFAPKYREMVRETICAPRFVPVDSLVGSSTDIFIVEVDVIPDSRIVGSNIFWTKFHLQNGGKKSNNLYTFSKLGLPVTVGLNKLKKTLESHIEARKKEENQITQSACYAVRCKKFFVFAAGFLFVSLFFYLLVLFDF